MAAAMLPGTGVAPLLVKLDALGLVAALRWSTHPSSSRCRSRWKTTL